MSAKYAAIGMLVLLSDFALAQSFDVGVAERLFKGSVTGFSEFGSPLPRSNAIDEADPFGDVIELATGEKVDGSGLTEKRKRMIATVAEKDLIIYPADTEKQTAVSIFTDTTCPYCRKLHEQIPALSKAGIEVRYLAFPRAGAQSQVAVDMASIWCAEDKAAAMTASKQGRSIEPAQCEDPVAEQHQSGIDMQIRGTPAIILENGEIIAGYLPAESLIQQSLAAAE